MGSIQMHRTVQIPTIDGISLEAWLYEVPGPAPAIIMTHGLNCVKEMSLAETAESSIGGSGGQPRNQIDPLQNAEDISDVVSYAAALSCVDARRILLWGMSLGGTISGVAAGVDRRVRGVVMVCPIFSMVRPDKQRRPHARPAVPAPGQRALRHPALQQQGENPIGYAGSGGRGGKEAYFLMSEGAKRGHPNFRDRITLQSYHKMALFRPRENLVELLHEVPTMVMVPEQDDISPAAEQKAVFDILDTPKRLYWARGKGHMSILTGEGSVEIREAMLEFFDLALKGQIK
ncbi:alpha/beta hydrolase family domain-containing protein [Apiospora saccharicola]